MTSVFEGNNVNSRLRELNAAEIEQVSGGVLPAVLWGTAKIAGGAFTAGFFGHAGGRAFDWLEGYFFAN
jgi:lactobin A/cerein 7B family class IIb bacteriocin